MNQASDTRGLVFHERIKIAKGTLLVQFNLPNLDDSYMTQVGRVVLAHAQDFDPDHKIAFEKSLALNLDGISNLYVNFTPNKETASEK